jgi:hypothetical protein
MPWAAKPWWPDRKAPAQMVRDVLRSLGTPKTEAVVA